MVEAPDNVIWQTIGRRTYVVRIAQDDVILCSKHVEEAWANSPVPIEVIGRTGRVCMTCWERADGR